MNIIALYLLLCLAICFNCDKASADEAFEENPKPIILKDIYPADESEFKLIDRDILLLGRNYKKSDSSLLYAALFADKYKLELIIYYSDNFRNENNASKNWRLACKHSYSWDHFDAGDIMIINTHYIKADNIIQYNIIHDNLFTDAWHTVYYDLKEERCIDDYESEFD